MIPYKKLKFLLILGVRILLLRAKFKIGTTMELFGVNIAVIICSQKTLCLRPMVCAMSQKKGQGNILIISFPQLRYGPTWPMSLDQVSNFVDNVSLDFLF